MKSSVLAILIILFTSNIAVHSSLIRCHQDNSKCHPAFWNYSQTIVSNDDNRISDLPLLGFIQVVNVSKKTGILWRFQRDSTNSKLMGFHLQVTRANSNNNNNNNLKSAIIDKSYSLRNVTRMNSFYVELGILSAGSYHLQIYPLPTDQRKSNKHEQYFVIVDSIEIINERLVDPAQIQWLLHSDKRFTINEYPGMTPFEVAVHCPAVPPEYQHLIVGNKVSLFCAVPSHPYFYTVSNQLLKVNKSSKGSSFSTGLLLPGLYDLMVTPFMDTPMNQCRRTDQREQPCRATTIKIPVGHFYCDFGDSEIRHLRCQKLFQPDSPYAVVLLAENAGDLMTSDVKLFVQESLPAGRQLLCTINETTIVNCRNFTHDWTQKCRFPQSDRLRMNNRSETIPTAGSNSTGLFSLVYSQSKRTLQFFKSWLRGNFA